MLSSSLNSQSPVILLILSITINVTHNKVIAVITNMKVLGKDAPVVIICYRLELTMLGLKANIPNFS